MNSCLSSRLQLQLPLSLTLRMMRSPLTLLFVFIFNPRSRSSVVYIYIYIYNVFGRESGTTLTVAAATAVAWRGRQYTHRQSVWSIGWLVVWSTARSTRVTTADHDVCTPGRVKNGVSCCKSSRPFANCLLFVMLHFQRAVDSGVRSRRVHGSSFIGTGPCQ